MTLEVRDAGRGNIVQIAPAEFERLTGRIEISGDDNEVRIGVGCVSTGNLCIVLGHSCAVTIGEACQLSHNFVFLARDARVGIGRQTAFNGTCWIQLHEPSAVDIGFGCLFGGDTNITTSDMHSIIDAESGKRINPAGNVSIQDNVWIGARAFILKGVTIGAGSIVGLGSIVTTDVPPHSVVAGNPARVVRTGVTWTSALLPNPSLAQSD
jgi:acetyltransferase-like isoleucine patch superfamily enzyme